MLQSSSDMQGVSRHVGARLTEAGPTAQAAAHETDRRHVMPPMSPTKVTVGPPGQLHVGGAAPVEQGPSFISSPAHVRRGSKGGMGTPLDASAASVASGPASSP